jgi:hypothetical protein
VSAAFSSCFARISPLHDLEVDIDRKAGKSLITMLKVDSASETEDFASSTFFRCIDIISTSGVLEYQLRDAKIVLII